MHCSGVTWLKWSQQKRDTLRAKISKDYFTTPKVYKLWEVVISQVRGVRKSEGRGRRRFVKRNT